MESINELNLTKMNQQELEDIDTLAEADSIPNRYSNTIVYVLKKHIEEDNVNDCRIPRDSFKKYICSPPYNLPGIIQDIFYKVYNFNIKTYIRRIMYPKFKNENEEYLETMNEYFKFAIQQKFIYENTNYILEAALAIQSTYITANKIIICHLKPGYGKIGRTYNNLVNTNNQYKKKLTQEGLPERDLVYLDHLEWYQEPALLISGYTTTFKIVDFNWQYISNHSLNYDPDPKYKKYDVYTEVEDKSYVLSKDHIFIIPFKNDTPLPLSKETYDDLVNFENIRWQTHKILANNKKYRGGNIMYHIWFNEKGNIYMGATPRMTKKRVPHLKKEILISILNDLNLDRLRYTINNTIPLEDLTVRMKIGIDHKYSTCKLHDIQYNEVQLSFIIDHPKDKTVQYHVSIYHDYLDVLLDDLLEINLIKEEKSIREALLVNGNIEKDFDEDKEYAPSLNLNHLKEVLKLFYITFDDYDKITNIKYHTIKEVSYPNRVEDRNLIYSSIIIKRHGYTGMLMKFVYNKETYKILIDEKTLSKLR